MTEELQRAEEVAEWLLITPNHLVKLCSSGTISKRARGRFQLKECVQAYIRYLRARAIRGDSEDCDYGSHKARLTRAQADLAEMQAQQVRGSLLPREAVLSHWQSAIGAARSKLISLPNKVAGRVMGAESLPEVESVIREAIYEAIADLSRTDGIPVKGSDVRVGSAAEPDRKPVGRSVQAAKSRGQRGARAVANKPRRISARDSGLVQ